ncbi:phosphotransferase family protein [Sandarakinorhabdus glacialis]|nr:phosphotransferase family protein [Polymorphobacter glacialis]
MDREALGSGPISNAALLTGGTQNILLRFERDGRGYVLRRPPPHLRANSNETMRREARMLAAIADTGVPHPRLIAACGDESVLGAAFYLMEPIDGFNATMGLPALHSGSPAIRRRMGLALTEGIAGLGALDYRTLGLEGFGKPDNYLARQVARWQSQLTSYGEFAGWTGPDAIPGVAQVAAWLEAHRPVDGEPGIIHGDYHLSNVMYRHDGPELAAIIDWELTTIGDPLIDLGWLMATWPEGDEHGDEAVAIQPWDGFPTIAELVDHYRPRTSRDLSAIDWYAVLACYKLGIILEGTHARACAGKAPRATGDLLHAKTVGLFERALRWIR